MDVREKLVEILAEFYGVDPMYHGVDANALADHLIAHGVTIQEWISVDDELPGDDSDVLACLRIGEESRICPASYAKGMWFDWIFNTPVTESITHWMPIPQPPKEERR